MADIRLPEPGTKLGPCRAECAHTDCAETRRIAARNCALCSEPIGYDRRFYITRLRCHDGQHYIDSETVNHASCLETDLR